MTKRKYRNKLEFVEEAFRACWQNSGDLMKAATLLLDNGFHAQALSLSVLALEELGKMYCIDGLLYARSDDHKAEAYDKSLKSHSAKLSALTFFPLFLGRIAYVDPRYGSEAAFHIAITDSINDLKKNGEIVLALFEGGGFLSLDTLKQQGFYAQPANNIFQTSNTSIKKDTAKSVYTFAYRAITTLDFLFKNGNIERYIASARATRDKMTEDAHKNVEEQSRIIVDNLFNMGVDETNEETTQD